MYSDLQKWLCDLPEVSLLLCSSERSGVSGCSLHVPLLHPDEHRRHWQLPGRRLALPGLDAKPSSMLLLKVFPNWFLWPISGWHPEENHGEIPHQWKWSSGPVCSLPSRPQSGVQPESLRRPAGLDREQSKHHPESHRQPEGDEEWWHFSWQKHQHLPLSDWDERPLSTSADAKVPDVREHIKGETLWDPLLSSGLHAADYRGGSLWVGPEEVQHIRPGSTETDPSCEELPEGSVSSDMIKNIFNQCRWVVFQIHINTLNSFHSFGQHSVAGVDNVSAALLWGGCRMWCLQGFLPKPKDVSITVRSIGDWN